MFLTKEEVHQILSTIIESFLTIIWRFNQLNLYKKVSGRHINMYVFKLGYRSKYINSTVMSEVLQFVFTKAKAHQSFVPRFGSPFSIFGNDFEIFDF